MWINTICSTKPKVVANPGLPHAMVEKTGHESMKGRLTISFQSVYPLPAWLNSSTRTTRINRDDAVSEFSTFRIEKTALSLSPYSPKHTLCRTSRHLLFIWRADLLIEICSQFVFASSYSSDNSAEIYFSAQLSFDWLSMLFIWFYELNISRKNGNKKKTKPPKWKR